LRSLSARYEAILAALPDIIVELDSRQVYTWANRSALDFFGDDLLGKSASHYFEGEHETPEDALKPPDGDEEAFYVEHWHRRRDGQKRLLGWWCRVLHDADGKPTGVLSSAHDVTDRVRSESQSALRPRQP
jgi:PAS domain S-box-containing protein